VPRWWACGRRQCSPDSVHGLPVRQCALLLHSILLCTCSSSCCGSWDRLLSFRVALQYPSYGAQTVIITTISEPPVQPASRLIAPLKLPMVVRQLSSLDAKHCGDALGILSAVRWVDGRISRDKIITTQAQVAPLAPQQFWNAQPPCRYPTRSTLSCRARQTIRGAHSP
jgi:hypothetical protein